MSRYQLADADRALTLHQPWAQLIRDGRKTVETRSWRTHHSGVISIHAGKTVDRYAARSFGYDVNELPTGVHVAVARLVLVAPTDSVVFYANTAELYDGRHWIAHFPDLYDEEDWVEIDVSERAFGDYRSGRFVWLLNDITPIRPVEASGKQGLWYM